jgi:DNA invertase Pin-like site-specific DNA recombinase
MNELNTSTAKTLDESEFASPKLQKDHLSRQAIVYVRQSTPQQVLEHRESAERQYALVDRAAALGWDQDQIHVIDEDQGLSGQSIAGRVGFQRLLEEIGLDRVGLILGLEMSRFARSCRDWHELLEECATFGTLLGDQDGLYDPTQFNDRMLLALKGTMSEAELHVLNSRLTQGKLNKADRGELLMHPPFGYVFSADKTTFEFDPDEQAQAVIRLLFAEFERQGTIYSLLRYLAKNDIRLPIRPRYGPNRGQLEWRRPNRTSLTTLLHHPTYAGAYRYGYRYHDPRKRVDGKKSTGIVRIPLEECRVLIKDRFPAYISWEQFETNRQKLAENQSRSQKQGAPRRGPSLLGGLVYCGRCGNRLMVTYSGKANRLRYQCARNSQILGEPLCQGIAGHDLDTFITQRIFKVLESASLELCLAATDDIEQERKRLDEHWQQRLERAAQNVDRCERQFQAVEPENRLVARTLEKNWEATLREQEKLKIEFEDFHRSRVPGLTDQQRSLVRNLSQDIPALWHAETTTPEDKQQIVRMLIDRIEINIEGKTEHTDVTLTWAGGFTSHYHHERVLCSYSQLSYVDDLIARAVELKETCQTLAEVAEQLTKEGFHALNQVPFTGATLSRFLVKQGINTPRKTEPPKGVLQENEWWIKDLANHLGMPRSSLDHWRQSGWVNARKLSGRRGRWVIWADESEVERLKKLRAERRRWSDCPFPLELTTPTSKQSNAS